MLTNNSNCRKCLKFVPNPLTWYHFHSPFAPFDAFACQSARESNVMVTNKLPFKIGEETSFWKWLLTQEKSECYQLFWAKHADGSKLLKQSFEKNLGKENKSLLHFQRIASHLENMNWEEANKSVDHMQRSQEYEGERFIALQDAEKLSKLPKSVQIESHNIKERRKCWRQKWM